MIGTILNVFAIIAGGGLGVMIGARLPEPIRHTVVAGLGLFTAAMGIQMFLKTENPIVVLISLLLGGLLGEWWHIEDRLRNLGTSLEQRFAAGGADQGKRFLRGFLTASLLFCTGPMAILGAIQDGTSGDITLLAIKSVLDGFASLAFASSLGIGVLFSAIMILIYQGSISLLAAQAEALMTATMMNEMTAVGGVLLIGVAVSSVLEIKPIRMGNFIPALFLAPILSPLIATILAAIGIS